MASKNGSEPRKAVRGLGPLEAQLMDALWSSPTQLSVQEVCDRLGPDHNYKTVMTVLNRLVEKDLLERQLDGRAYQYKPRQTRDQFLEAMADDLVHGYVTAYGPGAAKHLSVAINRADPAPVPAPAGVIAAPSPVATYQPTAVSYPRGMNDQVPLKLNPVVVLVGVVIALQVVLLLRRRR